MRVLFATAEFAPLARVGGLAEACAGLVRELRATSATTGVDVEVLLPDYFASPLADEHIDAVPVPDWAGTLANVRRGVHATVGPVTLVSTTGTFKPHPYVDAAGKGFADNEVRFFGFAAAVAALAAQARPDVLHLNDWHTALALGFLADPPPTVLTIHTLGYQGAADEDWLGRVPYRSDAYTGWQQLNPLLGAIRLADRVIAVSPTYAREIVTPEHGVGADTELAARGDALVGILNGIDVSEWNPAADPHIAARYDDATVIAGKRACRTALVERARFAGPPIGDDEPLIGVVSRLVHQKGVDLLLESVPFLHHLGARMVVLGSGDAGLADGLRYMAEVHPDRLMFVDGYDAVLAHQIFAGSDLFAMPSRFEPCGLAQMQAMAYGTLPIVTDVGGLHDTVVDADALPEQGTGIAAHVPSAAAVTDALWRAVRLWRDEDRRRACQQRGMWVDWSWKGPAQAHVDLYHDVTNGVRHRM
jgi:starch synthase